MRGRFVLTPRAQADLDEVWDYTHERWGIDQAEAYTRQLWKHIQTVADKPSLGRECGQVRAAYRQYPSGSHVLFYRLTDIGIDICAHPPRARGSRAHIP